MKRRPTPCPQCAGELLVSQFDASFETSDGGELLCFDLPGSMCLGCQQLYLSQRLIERLEVPIGHCLFAIEADSIQRAKAWSTVQA